jgi:CheY-like chemotaxis protein
MKTKDEDLQSKTIYIVDDDPDDRFLMQEVIHSLGNSFKVVELDNGAELIELLEASSSISIDLLILDMTMPRLNGIETIRAVRANAHYAAVLAVMLSTSSNKELIKLAYEAGITHFSVKPTRFTDLHDTISGVLSKFP